MDTGKWRLVLCEEWKVITILCWKINGSYYGFDSKGKRYTNTLFSIESNTYRAKSDGSLYVNEWYRNEEGTYYYYDEMAIILEISSKIGDSYYGFDLMEKCMQILHSVMKAGVGIIALSQMEVFTWMSGIIITLISVGCIMGLVERTIRMEYMR
mgnify:CR=1 FL=1